MTEYNVTEETIAPLIYSKMSAIMSDIDFIGKENKNISQGFVFRGIDDVYNALHSIMAKHGVFTIPCVLEDRTEERQTKTGGNLIYRVLRIQFRFFATDGSYVDAVVIGEGMDSGDKASNKAMAIGHKYALIQAFCIPTKEEKDPDAQTHEVLPKKKKELDDIPIGKATPSRKEKLKANLIKKGISQGEYNAYINEMDKKNWDDLSEEEKVGVEKWVNDYKGE